MSEYVQLFLLVSLGSVAGLIGGVVFLVKDNWARALCGYAVPFAAGVLLSVSLLHLIPESEHEMGKNAFLVVLAAFLGAFLFEQYFAHLHHHEDKKHTLTKATIPLVLFGDTIHNFIDGVAIAAAYLAEPKFGLIVAVATFLHETPHEIGDFGVLMNSGWSKKKTFMANLLSALATFPGAISVLLFAQSGTSIVGPLLGISAGIFLFLGASDFLPEVEEEHKEVGSWKKIILVFVGVIIMYLLTFLLPDHH